MVRLNQYGGRPEYQGIRIDYLRSFSKLWGVRSEVVNILKSFNPQTTEGQEDFANLKSKPPFEAFYETHGTKIGIFHRQVFSYFHLNGLSLILVLDCHTSICKLKWRGRQTTKGN